MLYFEFSGVAVSSEDLRDVSTRYGGIACLIRLLEQW